MFENLNLTIPRGKVTLISDISGSGKSTLLKLLLALYSPEAGSIRIGERDYRKMDFAEVMEAAKLARAHDFIMQKEEGYQTVVREQGSNFSGGERQRIAIARALLKNAPVLILDEASSAIDRQTEEEICKNFRELADQGKTVLVVSHRKNPFLQADIDITSL